MTGDPIDPCELIAAADGTDGAALLFVGIVRDHNEGREVGHLDYQAYPEMAETVLRNIVAEARSRWETGAVSVIHRIGRLEIGEVSVAIAVSSPHRGDAYSASRYVIEELKKRVPIWKREGYLDGESEWLRGSTPQPIGEGS
ncbi:MAG: molybdenum cofactor biosynthesis protein MoaE [Gemmatimonas sp.]|nr:molybdenum cofactor biosynthesis protein MoaE [Gemmatimonas sp.]